MERIKSNKLLRALSLLLLSGLFWFCADEQENDYPTIGGEENAITFSVKVPGTNTPKTYALNEDDENEVKQIAVLLFDSDGNYTSQPVYCEGSNITTDPGNSQMKSFIINVPVGTYDMVVLANSNQSLNNVLSSIYKGQPKAIVLNKLLLSNSSKWNVTAKSDDYMPIPMWGEVVNVSVTGSMSIKTPVTLIRMVAKINVALITPKAKEKFNLESVRLYNYNDQGQLVPDGSNWDNDEIIVTAPSIPSTAQKSYIPLVYDGTAITSDESSRGISVIDEIYTFEAALGTSSSLLTNTCLVVGGIYESDSQATYYRIDFANNTSSGVNYVPLLRNYNYKVNISNVKGSGLATPEDAFKTRPANIEASIINWSDVEITDIVFDGQYMLGVSEGALTFSREERKANSDNNTLSVSTDYPSGWKIDKIDGSWLDATIKSGTSGATTKTKLTMTENVTGTTRTGYIHLSAGRLNYIVKVDQLTTSDFGIYITDINNNPISVLQFVAAKNVQPEGQQFKLNWPAALSSLSYVNTAKGNAFTFATGGGLDRLTSSGTISDHSGTKIYTIRPTAITSANLASDPFYERTSLILYTISDGLTIDNKAFTLRQYVHNMVPVVDDFYMMDGKQKSFGVRSNVPFTVSVKSNPDNVITLRTTDGTINTSKSGTPIYFDIIDDLTTPRLFRRDVVVTISSPTGLFPDKDVTLFCESGIIQPESNSYISAPRSAPIFIPVSRANKSMLGTQLGVNESFTVELVWTDNSKRIASNSTIGEIRSIGSGSSGYLVVKTGSADGNAVVAIKNSSGKILWSWHIWVTDYSPGTGAFMGRNLGATSGDYPNVGNFGLFYQWGRKDPFPGSTNISNSIEPTLYTSTGTTAINKKPVAVSNNFGNSVANPSTFYYAESANGNDWYSNIRGTKNDELWVKGSAKTVYDPCPEGWRVPHTDVWSGRTEDNFRWRTFDYGRSGLGGFYPATGYRKTENGDIGGTGADGFHWLATVNGEQAEEYYFNMRYVFPKRNNYRAAGCSVRCVKE